MNKMNDVERVARALCAAAGNNPDGRVRRSDADPQWELVWAWWEDEARTAIEAHKAALADAGLVIVPREPTKAMINMVSDELHKNTYTACWTWKMMIDEALE